MQNAGTKRLGFKRIFSSFLLLALIAVLIAAIFFRQPIYDWYRLKDYTPPSEVAALARKTTMTADGRHLFYVSHPQISQRQVFSAQCRINERSIVLGCYTSNNGINGNIYLFSVDDKRLSGVKEVTAAHEMLHVAYDRLDSDEKHQINEQLINAYKKVTDKRIRETIKQYQDKDPSSVPNELHSILGTEVSSLPSELENYYKQYFKDRSAVVKLSEQYEAEFSSRQNQVEQYDAQLTALKSEIDSNQQQLQTMNRKLLAEQAAVKQLRRSGDDDRYREQALAYNQSVDNYNELVNHTKELINQYNELVKKRNALALEFQDLQNAIDSRPQNL